MRTLSPAETAALVWLAASNLGAFVLFGFDKWRATRAGRRIPEIVLVVFGAVGGWLGGLGAMLLFRHKTAKWTFQLKYAVAGVVCGALLWNVWRALQRLAE